MNTATVTWTYYQNYGTILQAYALQQVIIKLGHNNKIIDDSMIIRKKYRFAFIPDKIKDICRIVFHLNNVYARKSIIRNREYKQFKMKYLHIDFNTFPVKNLDKRYDIFICGSDQIWSPTEKIFDDFYFLEFTQKRKVAYAPSLGKAFLPDWYKKRVKRLLKNFDFISVRESKGAELLSELIGYELEVVLDPTLLLNSPEWDKVINGECTDIGKYILVYMLTPNDIYIKVVMDFAKKYNLKVCILGTSEEYLHLDAENIFCGPDRFLQLIKQAEIVFTDSFHGTIFSILFHKEFYTFKRFSDQSSLNQNSRIDNLFEQLDICGRLIDSRNLDIVGASPVLDYQKIDIRLNMLRMTSFAFLKKALS
ncbi:polysaccharide pyruvyl transferase family protein [uncultured Butyricimonas sp.]|uniref:polysaccharide pyruvyl transferase family protein n=1 Tax=uncultured Butyricimonas sp. TaxID=1268785 RepID=UPI0026DCD51F|nr:polysaccharide pyruvyl transferase family protein [uncultured Butyricimonas sp.]